MLAAWLQAAGYKTAHVGKFLNKYEEQDSPRTVAPGWDLWMTQLPEETIQCPFGRKENDV